MITPEFEALIPKSLPSKLHFKAYDFKPDYEAVIKNHANELRKFMADISAFVNMGLPFNLSQVYTILDVSDTVMYIGIHILCIDGILNGLSPYIVPADGYNSLESVILVNSDHTTMIYCPTGK